MDSGNHTGEKGSDEDLEFDTECAIGLYGPAISGGQGKLVLKRSGRHQRVVHRAPCNSEFGQSTQEITGCLCTEKARLGKISAEKVEDGARCAANRRWQASKDGKGLKGGMSGETNWATPDRVDGCRVVLVVGDGQGNSDAGVDQEVG